jgi:16S rRNA (adenine1518-N6/adenine1519-N6)-dimethyltransferase
MDLTSQQTIKELLAKHETRPNKRMGQNFLIDRNVLNKIISASELTPNDVVLEVGPGIGTLTQELAKNAGKIIAVEKDKTMVEILKETLAGFNNVEVLESDILNFKFQISNYKVIANIPYYLTSPLIRKFLEMTPPAGGPPSEIILMIQKEVAQRICPSTSLRAGAKPRMSILSVSVQFYAEPKIISYVSKNCFWPAPKVDSAIIKIIPKTPGISGKMPGIDRDSFFRVVKAGFSHPRKQLSGNLIKNLSLAKEKVNEWLAQNKIDPKQRAETLSVQDWKNLTNSL